MLKDIDLYNHTPSIPATVFCFGQAGGRIGDKLATYKDRNGAPFYKVYAINSNDGDLEELKNIPKDNQLSLGLGGLGKNPEKAIKILESNEEARSKLNNFIKEHSMGIEDCLFIGGFGGGTGTSTIIKALEDHIENTNLPLIKNALLSIQKQLEPAEFKARLKELQRMALLKAREKFLKIGVIATLPVRSDGPDVLRQVNNFTSRLWELRRNPASGINFVQFPDNQYLSDRLKEMGSQVTGYDNYRDFANNEIAAAFHEPNLLTNVGGTSITFDSQDFKRIIHEGSGSLVVSKLSLHSSKIKNSRDIADLFVQSLTTNQLHDPIALEERDIEGNVTHAPVHHLGLLVVIDQQIIKNVGTSFLDIAKDKITEVLPLKGTVFTGYVEGKNDYNVTVYTFFKTEALPTRLTKGLVEEYNEYQEKIKKVQYKTESIEQIAATSEENFGLDIDGFNIDFGENLTDNNVEVEEIDVDSLDFGDIDIDDLE